MKAFEKSADKPDGFSFIHIFQGELQILTSMTQKMPANKPNQALRT